MRDLGIIHCTISQEKCLLWIPIYCILACSVMESIIYTSSMMRKLLNIDRSAKERGGGNVYLTFHGARMYSDAARSKCMKKADIPEDHKGCRAGILEDST